VLREAKATATTIPHAGRNCYEISPACELLAMRVLIAAMQSEGHDASSLLRYHNECDIRRFTLQEAVYELKGS
jgi:hypothetical protein